MVTAKLQQTGNAEPGEQLTSTGIDADASKREKTETSLGYFDSKLV